MSQGLPGQDSSRREAGEANTVTSEVRRLDGHRRASLVMPLTSLTAGVLVLALVWLGPLPDLARQSFAAHMAMHMAVVAVGAPLVAVALSRTRMDPARRLPAMFAPVPASIVELVVVWAWHTPAWHHAARHETWALVLEQGSFAAAGLWLWMSACGGAGGRSAVRRGAGVVALLLTSMHMTLLGALFALANRPLFLHAGQRADIASAPLYDAQGTLSDSRRALADQQLGGTIMLLVGGASYLAGGLWLTAAMLRPSPASTRRSGLAAHETAS